MRKKQLAGLITAILLTLIFSFNCFAVLGNQDPDNPDADITYADIENDDDAAMNTQPQREVVYEYGLSEESASRINKLIDFWNNYGLLTILIVLAVIVAIAAAVSVREKKKLKSIEKQIDSEE